jgi:signal transduction histidine kinase
MPQHGPPSSVLVPRRRARYAPRCVCPPCSSIFEKLASALAAALLALTLLVAAPLSAAPVIQTIEQLRSLARAEQLELQNAAAAPVRLEGVVTYLREEPKGFNFNLDDGTGGIMVYPKSPVPLIVGQKVRIVGYPQFSRHGLCLRPESITAGDLSSLPVAIPITLADLLSTRMEGRFVEVDATVRRVRFEEKQVSPKRLALDLGSEARPLSALITEYQGHEERLRPGCRVRLQGVCLRFGNTRGQGLSTVLLVNSTDQVTLLAEVRETPVLAIPAVQEWTGLEDSAPRVSCEGVVTLLRPGELLVLQSGTRALRCRPLLIDPNRSERSAWPCAVGDQVRVTGFPALGQYTVELEYSEIVEGQPGKLPEAEELPSIQPITRGSDAIDRDARLIRLQGQLRGVQRRPDACALHLTAGTQSFEALLPPNEVLPPQIREGAQLSLTGICTLSPLPVERRFGLVPSVFSLWVQGAHDLRVTRAGPWWTGTRLASALGLTATASLGALFWGLRVRNRHHDLVREMRAREQTQRLLQEDRKRVASELHDTLQQTLLAADLQLNAALRMPPERLREVGGPLRLAHQLITRGREEIRDAVWSMHRDDRTGDSLQSILRRLTQELSSAEALPMALEMPEEEIRLSAVALTHASRIVREALTNALKHSHADRIQIRLHADPERLLLEVSDNGSGFDPSHLPDQTGAHLGLTGMRERAARLGGHLEIETGPGKGTCIRLRLPVQNQS